MRNRPEIASLFRCLRCHGSLAVVEHEKSADGHVITGALRCGRCNIEYPIRRGVPRFIPTELADDVASTVDGFGYQWTRANAKLKGAHFSSADVFLDFIRPVVSSLSRIFASSFRNRP